MTFTNLHKAESVRTQLLSRSRDVMLCYRWHDGRYLLESVHQRIKRLSEEFSITPPIVQRMLGLHYD